MGQQSKIVLFGALHWAEHIVVQCYIPLSMDPFNAPCRGDVVYIRSVRKLSAALPLLRKLQETLLKVMCQQFHGTGSLERNSFPRAHLENEDEKKKCVTGNFVSAQLDGSLVGDSFAGWLLKSSVLVLVTRSSFHFSFFTTLRETDRPTTTKILMKMNCIWYTFLLAWNIKYLSFAVSSKKTSVFQRVVTPCLPSLPLFTVVKTFFPSS